VSDGALAGARVLVTGGAGFIGSHLVDRLLGTERCAVTVVDDFDDFYDPALKRANVAPHEGDPTFRLVEADLLDDGTMADVFAAERFDAVVHLAARAGVRPSLADPLLYQRVNVEGTYRLLELSRSAAVPKFVFGSSSSVYGARSAVPFRETDDVSRPVSPYAATKLAAEAACHVYAHLYGMRVACLRFFTVYGPRQRPDLAIRKFAELMLAGRPVPLFGDGRTARDYTYVDDVVDGVVAAIGYDATPFEIVNLGGEHPVPLDEVVRTIAAALGVHPAVEWLPEQPGDVPLTCASVERARALLGYEPKVRFEEGIARFVEWLAASTSPA
jgi:UDP-glucuronate 4-epimerase